MGPVKTRKAVQARIGTIEQINANEGRGTVQNALTTMVVSSPLTFWNAYRSAPDSVADKTKYAVFAMRALKMAFPYQTAFQTLAAEFDVTIVAGIAKVINVFLRGNLWDLGPDSTMIILNKKPDDPAVKADSSGPSSIRRVDGATLTLLWL